MPAASERRKQVLKTEQRGFSPCPKGPKFVVQPTVSAKRWSARSSKTELALSILQQADSLILGHEVLSVTSRAKAMLIRFSSGYTMYSHNQLYGRWTVHLKTTDPKSNRSLRAEFITDKHAVRLWSATDIVLVANTRGKRPPIPRSPWARRARRRHHSRTTCSRT